MTPIEREKHTLLKMVRHYCRRHHNPLHGSLCIDCSHLIDYAFERLEKCPEGNCKPSCRKCIHPCYSPSRKGQIAIVMRFSGPRMVYRHPIAAVRHLFKELYRRPKQKENKQ